MRQEKISIYKIVIFDILNICSLCGEQFGFRISYSRRLAVSHFLLEILFLVFAFLCINQITIQ